MGIQLDLPVTIRSELKSGDLGNIVKLHGEVYSKEQGYDVTFEAYVAEPLAQCVKRSNGKEKIWIAEINGMFKGSAAICLGENEFEAQFRWFLLHADLRGKGIGRRLLNLSVEFAKSSGYQSIVLWTVKGLDTAAVLYREMGFKLEQEVSHQVWGAEHTEQKYRLVL